MSHTVKRKTPFLMIALVAAVFLLSASSGTPARAGDSEVGAVERTSSDAGPGVSIDRMSQEKAGIVTEALRSVSHQQEVEAYGKVLQPDDLITLQREYASAKAAVEKNRAALDASRREYERLKALNEDNGNVSEKALEAARAAWKADEADASAAAVSLKAVRDSAGLRWGRMLAGWIFGDSQEFRRLMDLEDVLIRVTLPPELHIGAAPVGISVRAPDGTYVQARVLARASQTDPRIQGMSFICLAPSAARQLVPGMNVESYMPVGTSLNGVYVPAAAVVWRNGHAWVYVKETVVRFVRRPVSTEYPVKDGYLVVKGFRAGERIAVEGAQMLLSAEFLPQAAGGGEDED
jgi:hypothetical protein